MINKLIELCIKHRFLVIVAFVLLSVAGYNSMKKIPVDAIPDIGELQVLVYAEWAGRSPKDIEDQVIYPLSSGLMGTPGVKVVRSSSAFGFGIVNMIFEEGTDFYWARTRVLERLNFATKNLPEGVSVTLGPDATAVGQIFWYTVENGYYCPKHPEIAYDKPGNCPISGEALVPSKIDLGELRSIQDWYVRYQLNSVKGVSEVASVGGYVKQYQIDVDPNALAAHGVNLPQVLMAVKKSNIDVGAKVFEEADIEFVVRGIGFIKSVEDIENVVITHKDGVPIYVKNVAKVALGPSFRRGALDREGVEVTGGVVIMRYGEKPLDVIKRVKSKIEELALGLPSGVRIVPFYDRTGLILRTVNTLKTALTQEVLITVFVIMIFLLHFRGSLIIASVLPIGILLSFILMRLFGIDANTMSLGGIAIAIGVMVDSGCVLVENVYSKIVHKKHELGVKELNSAERLELTVDAAQEVGRPVLFALLTTIVGFLPVFVLSGQAGKLFRPLAYTKTFAMFAAALIALMLLPALCYFLLRGKLLRPEHNKVSSLIAGLYHPCLEWSLYHKKIIVVFSILILAVGGVMASKMKQEFMPPINEGDLLFMPVLLPGASLTQVKEVMQKQDIIIKKEFSDKVEWVVGKLGRAETPTDPAPVIMIETVVHLKDKIARSREDSFVYKIPLLGKSVFKFVAKISPQRNWRAKDRQDLISGIQEKTRMPGVSPIMTQPIRNRIDMLATGIQTPVGIKVFGESLDTILDIGMRLEKIIERVPGAVSPYAERSGSRPYYEIEIDRKKAARYGVKVADIQQIIMTAVGGMNITTTIEGRERYPVRVRYMRELRDSVDMLERVLVPAQHGGPIPLSQLADLKKVQGPAMISAENALNYVRVFINVDQSEAGLVDFVKKAQTEVDKAIKDGELKLPAGYYISWSGQFEAELESRKTLFPALAVCLALIMILLYFAFNSIGSLLILATGIPVSLMGGIIFLYISGFRFSTAVWVGFIALFGVATDNAVVLISTMNDRFKYHKPINKQDIRREVAKAAGQRLQPIIMTTMTTIIALMPVMLSTGAGSEVMKPMAAPTVGGLVTVTLSNLFLVPVLYGWWKERMLS